MFEEFCHTPSAYHYLHWERTPGKHLDLGKLHLVDHFGGGQIRMCGSGSITLGASISTLFKIAILRGHFASKWHYFEFKSPPFSVILQRVPYLTMHPLAKKNWIMFVSWNKDVKNTKKAKHWWSWASSKNKWTIINDKSFTFFIWEHPKSLGCLRNRSTQNLWRMGAVVRKSENHMFTLWC